MQVQRPTTRCGPSWEPLAAQPKAYALLRPRPRPLPLVAGLRSGSAAKVTRLKLPLEVSEAPLSETSEEASLSLSPRPSPVGNPEESARGRGPKEDT